MGCDFCKIARADRSKDRFHLPCVQKNDDCLGDRAPALAREIALLTAIPALLTLIVKHSIAVPAPILVRDTEASGATEISSALPEHGRIGKV